MPTFTSRQFNQDAGGAKRASAAGPVFITDRGRPAHVLMTIEHYRRLSNEAEPPKTIVEMLAMEGDDIVESFDEELRKIRDESRAEAPRPVDLD